MISIGENVADLAQSNDSSVERLRSFMQTHGLNLEELAALLRTPPQTLESWFDEGTAPPACLLALMVLLEAQPQAQSYLGVRSKRAVSRGSSFRRENRVRLGGGDKEEALRRVRAI